MSHLKSYVGSIVLAALLLQGCGSSSDESTATQTNDSAQDVKTAATISALTDTVATLDATSTQDEVDTAFRALKLELSAPESSTTATAMQTAGILETVAGGLANILDSSLGDTVTTAAFDVVLNSEGVTVVMIDLARGSEGTSEIMINAMEADWSLSEKMCPMLRTSTEFGEKFTALAEEQDAVGRFFFERIDANMYNCLADAMLLSNNEAIHDESVSHSTNGYMGLLMDRYATDYFITPTGSTDDRRNDKFVSLLLDTGDKVDYNSTAKTFTGHGDANELTNEKFFYSLFKTPTTTDAFVSAMDKVKAENPATVTMLMDNIFLGNQDNNDTMQGKLNIISIGSAMYDGIYGVADTDGNRTGEYGFASYAGAFVGFAGLIPGDRYMTYAKAFVGAGYQYASFHGINVWTGVSSAAKFAWDAYTAPEAEVVVATDDNASNPAPARSAGLGITGSDWYDDITDLLFTAYTNFDITFNLGNLYDAAVDSNKTISAEITNQLNGLKDEGSIAYRTIIDGRDENNVTAYPTILTHNLTTDVDNDKVYGLHGLIELAMQEDLYYVECGNRSSHTFILGVSTGPAVCENNASYTMSDANASFQLPQFSELTWSFAYGTAKDGAMNYYSTNVDAEWFANLSSNELVRQYFYPSADNVYIPSWLLAIDWLKATDNFNNATIAETDLNFNSGYFDIYVTSTNPSLLTDTLDENNNTVFADIDLATVAGLIKKIEISRLEMGNDGIIAIGADGTNLDGLYVYKVRTITPEDTQAVLTALSTTYSNVTEYALGAIGLDSSNAANVDTTDVTDTNSTNTLASAQ